MKTYLVTLHGSNLVKFGRTKNIKSRTQQIKTSNPFIKSVVSVDGDFESFIHRCLNEFRVTGEWFDLGDLNEKEIENLFASLIQIRTKSINDCEAVSKYLNLTNY